jgi:hypothetical protein
MICRNKPGDSFTLFPLKVVVHRPPGDGSAIADENVSVRSTARCRPAISNLPAAFQNQAMTMHENNENGLPLSCEG